MTELSGSVSTRCRTVRLGSVQIERQGRIVVEPARSMQSSECYGVAERRPPNGSRLSAGDSLVGARGVDDSPCPPGHNTRLPLERSPPASFKRLLGGRRKLRGQRLMGANGGGVSPSGIGLNARTT